MKFREKLTHGEASGLFISNTFEQAGEGGGLLNLETTMVSVLHKEL